MKEKKGVGGDFEEGKIQNFLLGERNGIPELFLPDRKEKRERVRKKIGHRKCVGSVFNIFLREKKCENTSGYGLFSLQVFENYFINKLFSVF